MKEEIENPTTAAAAAAQEFSDDMDSCCSTPYVSAPSSPGRDAPLSGFYYSAPASPMHFMLSSTTLTSYPSAAANAAAAADSNTSFEFDFSATLPPTAAADELFFNGQIRPMKLSTHLQRPQLLDTLVESDDVAEEEQTFVRGRELKSRAGSLRRRTRSMSPVRTTTTSSRWETTQDENPAATADNPEEEKESNETTPSAGRSSKRWGMLKEFLYRSKSEGRNHEGHKFWGSLSFPPVKMAPLTKVKDGKKKVLNKNNDGGKKRVNNISPISAHELHYTAKRAQAEEMRKKTFLPYKQGLFGCLGFSSKSYGAINGFARAFNTVSSR